MKATEFIRGLLDLIDQAQDDSETTQQDYELEVTEQEPEECAGLANSPDTLTVPTEVILAEIGRAHV